MKKFLDAAKVETDKAVAENVNVSAIFKKVCDWYIVSANDEIREKSDLFFKFWNNIFDQINKSMPKIEAPKKAKKEGAGGGAKVNPQRAAQAAMMAEMAAKRAAMAAKK